MYMGIDKNRITVVFVSTLFIFVLSELLVKFIERSFEIWPILIQISHKAVLVVFAIMALTVTRKWSLLKVSKIHSPIYLLFFLPGYLCIIAYGEFQALIPLRILLLFFLTLLAVCAEEILFRGVFQDYLRPVGRIKALFALPVIFALFHLPNSVENAIHAFFVGALYFLLREKFNMVWPLILDHFLHNFSLHFVDFSAVESQYHDFVFWVSVSLLGLSVFAIFLIEWIKKNKKEAARYHVE